MQLIFSRRLVGMVLRRARDPLFDLIDDLLSTSGDDRIWLESVHERLRSFQKDKYLFQHGSNPWFCRIGMLRR